MLCSALSGVLLAASPAHASESLGNRALDMAESRTGDWYVYGAAGPYSFDCSGLVYWSVGKLGITLPRTTYGMLAGSSHLYFIPVWQAQRGDLLFFGSGHVEFDTMWWHMSYGAQQSGTRVGWHGWGGWYYPTMAMRIR
jgi:cell wall-associated NlpC family hydrolase